MVRGAFMENGKFDLNLQVLEQLPEQLRAKTIYKLGEESPLLWEVIVKYHGNLAQRGKELSVQVEELENNVAIVFLRPEQLQAFSRFPEVDYMELPRRLWYNLNESKQGICLDGLQRTGYPASNAVDVLNGDAGNQDKSNLYGAGVLIAIIDSGIEYANMDFRNADGTTRIVALWDQTVDSSTVNEENQQFTYGPPTGYILGTLFTEEMINTALQQTDRQRRYAIVPSIDVSGHGTHVAGIACGNGNASNGTIRGVAPLAQMLIVKLGDAQGITFPRTTRLLEAIDFTIKTAEELNMPVAINLSFGNNAGPHTGTDLVSEFLNAEALKWKNAICVGTGNEGNLGRHAEGKLEVRKTEEIELAVGGGQTSFYIQFWKNYVDTLEIEIQSPDRKIRYLYENDIGIRFFEYDDCVLVINYGEPSPFQTLQEIYMEWIPQGDVLSEGIWTFRLKPNKVVDGRYDIWLPTGNYVQLQTQFLRSSVNTTLTTPSSGNRLLTVGAYDEHTGEVAPFSGRGYTRKGLQKPDIVAPGVDILSVAPNNSYAIRSGTSMATPFVTGAAALMMEWGIVRQNDLFLYGEKLKAYIQKGAVALPGETVPNNRIGYGALCLSNSIP